MVEDAAADHTPPGCAWTPALQTGAWCGRELSRHVEDRTARRCLWPVRARRHDPLHDRGRSSREWPIRAAIPSPLAARPAPPSVCGPLALSGDESVEGVIE